MSYKIISIPEFDRQFKRLSKKFPSLKKEIAELAVTLQANPITELQSASIAIKSGYQLHRKQKAKAEAPGS